MTNTEQSPTTEWSHANITDPTYRAKFVAIPDVMAEWLQEHGGLAGRDVLDFGCGEAETALGIALRHKARRVVGVEIHEALDKCLPRAREQIGLDQLPNNLDLRWIQADSPLDDLSQFDFVYSWSVFEHVSQEAIVECLTKLRRLVRPTGCMFLQISPLYYSAEGSHLKPWIPEPWAHLTMQQNRFHEALVAGSDNREQADHLWLIYETLNRTTAPELLRAITTAGFEVIRDFRTADAVPVPAHLLEVYTHETLTTQQIVLLTKPI